MLVRRVAFEASFQARHLQPFIAMAHGAACIGQTRANRLLRDRQDDKTA
jgi:hypothetical protein